MRVHDGDPIAQGLYPDDEIPPTLVPVLDKVFAEFIPMLKAFGKELDHFVEKEGEKAR